MNKLRSADDDELYGMADYDAVLGEMPQDEKKIGVVLPVTDKLALIRLLTRKDEVAQARQPGQGRREAIQCMREAADANETLDHTQTNATDPSAFGASEQEKNKSLAHHRELLQKLRESVEKTPTCETQSGNATTSTLNEVGVEPVPVEDTDWTSMGPIDFAKYLCDQGTLNGDQWRWLRGDMQIVFDEEVAKRANLTDVQLRAESIGATEHVTPIERTSAPLIALWRRRLREDQDHQLRASQALSTILWRQRTRTHSLLQQSIATHSSQN